MKKIPVSSLPDHDCEIVLFSDDCSANWGMSFKLGMELKDINLYYRVNTHYCIPSNEEEYMKILKHGID